MINSAIFGRMYFSKCMSTLEFIKIKFKFTATTIEDFMEDMTLEK
jgi:hypothetical protein